MARLLNDQGFGPVFEAEDVANLVASAQRRPIDIAILDLDQHEVLALVGTLRSELPELQVMLVAAPPRQTPQLFELVDDAGLAEGTGEPPAPAEATIQVDREALVGALVQGFRAAAADATPHRNWSRITARQRDVMRWLAMGLDNAAIGQKLRIGERAVKAHISSLLALFGLANRTQLALLADRAGLRPPVARR